MRRGKRDSGVTALLAMVLLACLCGCAQQTVSFCVKPVEVSADSRPATATGATRPAT